MNRLTKIYLGNSIVTGGLYGIKNIYYANYDGHIGEVGFIAVRGFAGTVASGFVGILHPITIPYAIKRTYDLRKLCYSWDQTLERL